MCSDTGQKSAKQVKTAVFWEQNINITKLGKYFSLAHVTCLGLGPTYAVHLRPSHFGIGWQPEALSRSQASHMWGTWHASSIWVWGAISIWSLAHWHILYPPRSRHQLQLHLRSDPGISELHLMPISSAPLAPAKFHTLGRLIQARSFDVHLSRREIRWRGLANRTTVTTSPFGWSTHIYTMM